MIVSEDVGNTRYTSSELARNFPNKSVICIPLIVGEAGLGAVIIALPLTSILAMSWLYLDTRNNELLAQFARDIFMLVPVSLLFFLPFLIEKRTGTGFIANMFVGLALLVLGVWLLRRTISS